MANWKVPNDTKSRIDGLIKLFGIVQQLNFNSNSWYSIKHRSIIIQFSNIKIKIEIKIEIKLK